MKMNPINREKNNTTLVTFIALFFIFSAHLYAQTDTVQTNVPALKDLYANDFKIGCLLSYRYIGFPDDPYVPGQSAVIAPNGGNLVKFHMNSMSPGNNMKPQYTVDIDASAVAYNGASADNKDSINTHPVIRFNGDIIAQLNWAKRLGFTFRGHTLVWHSQTPGTGFFRTGYSSSGTRLTKEKMTERMDNYIKEVIRLIHEDWPGLLSAMDVVNEAVNDNGADRTTDSEWYVTFGDNSYLMKAFELARKYTIAYGETQMKLYYNDYNTHNPNKANGIVRICNPIFQAGYLDGIGMQEHDSNSSPTAEQWIATYDKFDPICTEMAVTELDVTTGYASPSSSVLATQANQYGQLFKCFVERSYLSGCGKIISVSKDGLNDQYTFKTNQSSSLWDSKNQCKPAFYAVVDLCKNYHALDSLITYADSLQTSDYSTESWSTFVLALVSAKNAMDQNYSASVSAADALGEAKETLIAAIESLVKNCTDVNVTNGNVPNAFMLNQNYPNPFNPKTEIRYQLAYDSQVTLTIYDILGNNIRTLVHEHQPGGYYSVLWHATDDHGNRVISGVYFYEIRVIAKNELHKQTRKMTLMK